ncbi:MAG: hypothetical protein B6U76_01255 [Desulfurococcales archaeon ex4484_217_2]|nr:MAG: hypothetical protein B6U76_01255 [Desulfurococcales archaeon ex4484_217_2]
MSQLKKELGLLEVISITSGSVIGAGIFVVTGLATKYSGNMIWLAYLLGGIPTFFTGLAFAILAGAMPYEGGSLFYTTRFVSPFWGFLTAWGKWMGYIGPICITALAFPRYVSFLVKVPELPVALLAVFAFFMLNYVGIKLSGWVQDAMFITLVGGMFAFIILGFPHVDLNLAAVPDTPLGIYGVAYAAALAFFSYTGFGVAIEPGEEVKNPERNLPLGIILGVFLVVAIYALLSFVCVGVMPWKEFAAAEAPVAEAAARFLPFSAAAFIAIVGIMAILTSQNGFQIVGSRLLYAFARDGLVPRVLAKIHPRFGTPHLALLATVLIGVGLILSGKGIEFAAGVANIGFLASYALVCLAALNFARKYPERYSKAPFKLRKSLLYVVALAGFVSNIVFMALQSLDSWMFFIIWIIIGLGVYYYAKKSFERRGEKLEEALLKLPG